MPAVRLASTLAAATALAALPVGDAALPMALLVAIDLAGATLVLRTVGVRLLVALWPEMRTVTAIGDPVNLRLFRRTVPALRSRKSAAVIEAQIAWRRAGDIRRQQDAATQRPS